MSKKQLQIHSENILPIIKRWLYSDKDIFVRELVSNACDALYKVKVLQERGEAAADQRLAIEIKIDKTNRTLKFIDTGIGMDEGEVQKYIAQIAFSGAEEFLEKYKSTNEKEQVIGHFGLGFYSAYMVAEKVEIQTLSYKQAAEPVFWSCDGSSEYELTKGNRTARGTEITLYLDKENEEYLDEARLNQILKQYCNFLPYPILLNGKQINDREPLWIKTPADCSKEEYLSFYRYLYPFEEDPLFWIHLNVDYPFHLKGILYFPKINKQYNPNKSSVSLYCNRVFVSDNCKDVIPNYLMPLRGIIDSPDIPLNVSRSYLQMDRTIKQLSTHISKKVSDSLLNLYRNERERFLSCWEDISIVVKLGVLEDDKFYEKVKDFLVWQTVEGNWTTLEDYLENNRNKTNNKVYYTNEKSNLQVIELFKKKNIDVLYLNAVIDNYLIGFLEGKLTNVSFQRIDAGLDETILDKDKEKTILDESGRTEAAILADLIRQKLSNETIHVEARSLASTSLPAMIIIDENQRRLREHMHAMDPKANFRMADKRSFVVNTNSSLVNGIQKLDKRNPELAKELVHQMYEMALLNQHEMDPHLLNQFITRTTNVLEKLITQYE